MKLDKKFITPLLLISCSSAMAKVPQRPNIIVINCDDMGYGDPSCYGNASNRTPSIDKMAQDGQKWSCFYNTASLSSPSRGGLLTGKYGVRSGLYGNKHNVLFPGYEGGITSENNSTIATYLRDAGYTTLCVGKWHLGDKKGQLPMDNGFDHFFGIPYSNDMIASRKGMPPLPLYDDEAVVETEPDQQLFTSRFTDYTIDFIDENKGGKSPFFIYLAHPMPHDPIFASNKFKGSSARGLYGDVIEELDYNIGRLIDYLKDEKLDKNTLVVFISDNGPWVIKRINAGSNGELRDGKASAFEGGFRTPCIFWGCGVEQGSQQTSMGSPLDLLPTFCELASIELPADPALEGESLVNVLNGQKNGTDRNVYYYYRGGAIHAIREGSYKLHVKCRQSIYFALDVIPEEEMNNLPWLYNVNEDPGEKFNIANENQDIVQHLLQLIADREREVVPVNSIFDM